MQELLPPPNDSSLEEMHERTYAVKAYRKSDDVIVLRGAVRDIKPPDLYVPDDPEPMSVHHMIVELEITVPDMLITNASVVFEVMPHHGCPSIAPHYGKLVGLNIARGFTHKVRELFGGPRGCTHTTALLQAMAPVAIQSIWSLRAIAVRDGVAVAPPQRATREQRLANMRFNLNTCHIWDENGEMANIVADGGDIGLPLWIENRYAELGRDPVEWRKRMGNE